MNAVSALQQLSNSLASQVESAQSIVVAIRNPERRHLSAILWRSDVVLTSEQSMGERNEYEVVGSSGGAKARIVGRDPATNLLALQLDSPFVQSNSIAFAGIPRAGELVMALAANADGVAATRLGSIHSVGPQWRSRLGGRIERRIALDIRLSRTEEGGPVLDMNGAVLGMSTLGPAGQVLVIPSETIGRVIPQLLRDGHVAHGWLGLGLQPVAVPDALRESAAQSSGMMVMSIAGQGPAAQAGVKAGDVVISVDNTPMRSVQQLSAVLDGDNIGKRVQLRAIRGGEVVTIELVIGARPKP